ncbi:hypothetical protein SCAR479_11664 [Seiridium cardinale]|uniref:Uncharacterized protein n=1 Tax=Seiridium cardinale TaxID=138064 RepID=A0ABR2XCR8_9PEZI
MSASPPNQETDGRADRLELLSIWNQSSPRVYISVILCFPFDNAFMEHAVEHIETSLKRLGRERPLFASRLQAASSTQPGHAHLIQSPEFDIPFEVSSEPCANIVDYEQMRQDGFPPGLFIQPRFGIPGVIGTETGPLPVSRVHALVIDGGLLLGVYLHHSLCDGDSLRIFLECFAAETRGDSIDHPSEQAFDGPRSRQLTNGSLSSLVSKCPEYTLLPQYNGPTQPRLLDSGTPLDAIPKIGKIFVFKKKRIAELQKALEYYCPSGVVPSKYTCLAALSFAHIVRARLQTERFLPPIEAKGSARLWNSVNWRSRAFQDLTGDYFGNAALPAVTKATRRRIVRACEDTSTLASLAPLIKSSIDAVDEAYVKRRLAMVSALPDPRIIGVNYDPRMAQCLAFNTWRHFGADAVWDIPGVPVGKPDAIRRAHGSWNLGTALILPARASSDCQELFVSLSQVAMDALCKDEGWLRWVDRVIG